MEQSEDPAQAQGAPDEFTVAGPAPATGGKEEVMGGEVPDHRER